MKDHECTESRFLDAVTRHEMTILREDGVGRHIRFKRPDSGAYWFDLITWPGTLCIDGDCGTYVFRRIDDMFEFFRTDREYFESKGHKLGINPSYWGEKLQSISRFGEGFVEFDEDRFREVVKEHFDEWVERHGTSQDAKDELWSDIENEVLSVAADGETRAMDAAMSYSNGKFRFVDFWDHNFQRFTFHFIWCCYAIAWGIQTYDASRLVTKEAA